MRRSNVLIVLAVFATIAPSVLAGGRAVAPICRFRGTGALEGSPGLAPASGPGAVCRRPRAGAVTAAPADIYSRDGHLNVRLNYFSSSDRDGRILFCFRTDDGEESPTLHVRPGDTLDIVLANRTQSPHPPDRSAGQVMVMGFGPTVCGSAVADTSAVNLHFHGASVSAACHGDDVIHTSVNAGESFTYHVTIPRDQPPGLYWYHPHIHGLAEAAVLGGASGAIVVDGIDSLQPIVARLPQRMLVIRDQLVAGRPRPGGGVPSWDVSLNYVPIAYPALIPAVIRLRPGRREFWRVLNASADTVVDLRLSYDGVDQPLQVAALDGVPTGSDYGHRTGRPLSVTHVQIPAAGRAEFVITAPAATVKRAVLETAAIDTGPDGDIEPARTLARLEPDDAPAGRGGDGLMAPPIPAVTLRPPTPGFESIDAAQVTRRRRLFFSEQGSDDVSLGAPTQFFITVVGDEPAPYDPLAAPAIVTTEGAVEVWTIENQARETHEFHLHQVHFKLVGRDDQAIPKDAQQYYDTVQIPYWRGSGPYPSITVLVDFRGVTGDLLYHCHILQHEDAGMMAVIRVLPRKPGPVASAPSSGSNLGF
jgi:FtsP/CotA-like multicopper oxidase with cupredoxin domain